jgi:hypothetical protein
MTQERSIKSTSRTHVSLARGATLATSSAAGLSVGLGIYPDAMASGGGAAIQAHEHEYLDRLVAAANIMAKNAAADGNLLSVLNTARLPTSYETTFWRRGVSLET